MKYMLMFYFEENTAVTQEQREQCYQDSAAFANKLHATGNFVAAMPLQPTSTSTSIRYQDGKRVVTDGPFAETREQLGGFFIINAKHLDEAIEIASHVPAGKWGTVEIRPAIEVGGLPEENSAKAVDSAAAHSSSR
jgi:hypothetical protein